jgi:ethanolamine utilization protein EutP (predicted NTPase)
MKSDNFKIGKISEDFHLIVKKVSIILKEIKTDELFDFEKKINTIENGSILKVAFVGQYSSGKSTIVSALTGDKNIKIDADIATDHTTDYKWNDIILTDTPGLYTDRPEHDQITNEKIKESDLLVFCLTSDLFDNIILTNFKKLAFMDNYKNKMMLVVNKMSMESGDYKTLKRNYEISLRKSLSPYNFDDFKSSFIDAADYIEGKEESNESLIELSHFKEFTDNLNSFVQTKGLLGKLDTPLRIVISSIDNTLIEISSKEDKELFQTLERIEYSINKNKERTEAIVKAKITELSLLIISKSNELTSKVGDENLNLDEEEKSVNLFIENETEKVRCEIQDIIEEQNKIMEEQISGILESDLAQYAFKSIDSGKIKLTKTNLTDLSNIVGSFEKVKKGTNIVAESVLKSTNTSTVSGIAKAGQVAGSQGHQIVFQVGKFFGTKFKPWQAVNIAKNVANVCKWIGPILSFASLALDCSEVAKESSNAKKIADAKRSCYNEFLTIANNIENEFIKNFEEFKRSSYIKMLDQIRDLRANILKEKKQSDEVSKALLDLKSKLDILLKEIYE